MHSHAVIEVERIDGYDKKGHLIRTKRVMTGGMKQRQVEAARTEALAMIGSEPGVVRARVLPMKGAPIDIDPRDLKTYVEGYDG